MNVTAIDQLALITDEAQKRLLLETEQNAMTVDEAIGDRVYNYPEGLPSEALSMLIDFVEDEDVTDRELDYLYYVLITIPKMASLTKDRGTDIAEDGIKFHDYVHFQISRMKRLVSRGLSAEFCFRIRKHLSKFMDI